MAENGALVRHRRLALGAKQVATLWLYCFRRLYPHAVLVHVNTRQVHASAHDLRWIILICLLRRNVLKPLGH